MPLSPALAPWLGQNGHDAVHAAAICLERAPGASLLARARGEGRVILTADLDYPRLLFLLQAEGPGLILFRGGTYTDEEVLNRVARVLETIPASDLERSIVVIERDRIRRRRLPLEPPKNT